MYQRIITVSRMEICTVFTGELSYRERKLLRTEISLSKRTKKSQKSLEFFMDKLFTQAVQHLPLEYLNQNGLLRTSTYSTTVILYFLQRVVCLESMFTEKQFKTKIEARKSPVEVFLPREFVQAVHDKLNLTKVFTMFNTIKVRIILKLLLKIEKRFNDTLGFSTVSYFQLS